MSADLAAEERKRAELQIATRRVQAQDTEGSAHLGSKNTDERLCRLIALLLGAHSSPLETAQRALACSRSTGARMLDVPRGLEMGDQRRGVRV